MSDQEDFLVERNRLWDDHPLIMECAILPTRPVQDAVARVINISRKSRASIAFWADPVTGKSFCIQAIKKAVGERFPDAGVLLLEFVADKQEAEGRLLVAVLKSIDFCHKPDRELAGKRDQVNRALISLSGLAKHLFIYIDEAQEASNAEFGWLKAVINGLSRSGIKVTTVLFGQRELLQRKVDLKSNGRSDLAARFMKILLEFRGLRVEKDIEAICEALDERSEFPVGSGWSYTMFMLPRAHASGFRFKKIKTQLWAPIVTLTAPKILKKGLPMELIASYFANLCIACKNKDHPDLSLSEDLIAEAFKSAVIG